jgi:hypothetical protein
MCGTQFEEMGFGCLPEPHPFECSCQQCTRARKAAEQAEKKLAQAKRPPNALATGSSEMSRMV